MIFFLSTFQASDKAAHVRISSFLTSRHLSQRRIRLPARKYNPKTDGAKVWMLSFETWFNEQSYPNTEVNDYIFLFFLRFRFSAMTIIQTAHQKQMRCFFRGKIRERLSSVLQTTGIRSLVPINLPHSRILPQLTRMVNFYTLHSARVMVPKRSHVPQY